MPRKARITVVGAIHHIMARRIEGQELFFDDSDRIYFRNHLENLLLKSGYLLYGWCLMSNHYHLLIRINEYPLSNFMRILNGQYAQYLRKKIGNRGFIFQDRYKSIVTQDQNYIEEMIRYIHLNPIRANILKTILQLDTYPWTGHSILVGRKTWSIQNTIDILKRFSKDKKQAVVLYRKFIKDGLHNESSLYSTIRATNYQKENIHNSGSWVIGNREFISKAFENDNQHKTRLARYIREGITIDEIVSKKAKQFGLSSGEIMHRGKNNLRSHVRKICAYILHCTYGFPVIAIANYFNISSPSTSNLIKYGALLVKNKDIKN